MSRTIKFSVGEKHPAEVKRTMEATFAEFCEGVLRNVPETEDKASAGWICGAEFSPPYRHGDNFVARHLLSLDYDHIKPEDVESIIATLGGESAFLAYTTWSHASDRPRLRLWLPLSRPVGWEEFQAVSRSVAARAGIDKAARESHTPAQFMYRPAIPPFGDFQSWKNTHGAFVDVDKVLGEYSDWRDRRLWPRAAGDEILGDGASRSDPREKPGLVGAFCRAFTISAAIEHFGLPYKPGSADGRWTYTAGSRADGAVIYDDDTKIHSHHDTDPARGQHNAYDLVRLHRFGDLDAFDGGDTPIAERPSTRAMETLAAGEPLLRGWNAIPDNEFVPLEGSVGPVQVEQPADRGAEQAAPTDVSPKPKLPPIIPEARSKTCDLENARRLQKHYRERLISVAGVFFMWNGKCWAQDDKDSSLSTPLLMHLPRFVSGDAEALEANSDGSEEAEKRAAALHVWAGKSGDESRLNAATRLFKRNVSFKANSMNRAHHLLNCPNGTVDLRTGRLHEHRYDDFITAMTPTEFNPQAECPRFERFLEEIYGDASVVKFAQRWFGYCITGDVREGHIVFHVGEGGNGKGTLIDTISRVVGQGYAITAPRGLLSKPSGSIPNDVAMLYGRRMVTDRESDDREEFNEGLLKQLTGGDAITARFLHAEFFEFWPTHKLQIFTNNKPRIRGQDRGMWRRPLLVEYPFLYGEQTDIDAGKASRLRDKGLPAYLATVEKEGILRWLVEGARQWYEGGLAPPKTVLLATEAYRAAQDITGTFLAEKVVKDPDGVAPLTGHPEALLTAYQEWMRANNYSRTLGRNKFKSDVERCMPWVRYGTHRLKGHSTKGFKGIRLRREDEPE